MRLSFRNKLSRPLILGYVARSGAAVDDRGHKYEVAATGASRASASSRGAADQKFVLQPGEASDARFEFAWYASPQEIFGLSFQVDLAIREIETIAGNQLRLGREHSLHFSGLGNRAATAPAASRGGDGASAAVSRPAGGGRGAFAGGPVRRKPGVLQRGSVRR